MNLDQRKIPSYNDYTSQYYNVTKGHRVTRFSPKEAAQKIYIIGGSAVLGLEVPDEWTLPSQLQKLIGEKAEVQNYGYSGITSNEELNILKNLDLRANDIVIIYHGVNDALSGFLNADNVSTNQDEAAENHFINSLSKGEKTILKILNDIRYSLLKVHFFKNLLGDEPTFIFQNFVPDFLKNQKLIGQITDKLNEHLTHNINGMIEITNTKNAALIHIFQPYLQKNALNTPYEKNLLDNKAIYPLAVRMVLAQSYFLFGKIENGLKTYKVPTASLSGVLSTHENHGEYFLDFCHLNHEGNRLIASQIYNFLDKNDFLRKN